MGAVLLWMIASVVARFAPTRPPAAEREPATKPDRLR